MWCPKDSRFEVPPNEDNLKFDAGIIKVITHFYIRMSNDTHINEIKYRNKVLLYYFFFLWNIRMRKTILEKWINLIKELLFFRLFYHKKIKILIKIFNYENYANMTLVDKNQKKIKENIKLYEKISY